MFSTDERSVGAEGRVDRRAPVDEPRGGSLLDPLFIARFVWKARFAILVMGILGAALAAAIAMVTPKVYEASTQIFIDPRDIKIVQNEITPSGLSDEATIALIQSQIAVVYSNGVIGRVIDEAGLERDPEFNGGLPSALDTILKAAGLSGSGDEAQDAATERQLTMQRVRRAMEVARDAKSFVVNLSFKSRDAQKAAMLSRLTADIFIDELAKAQSDTARRASLSLTSRLAELRRSVVEAERAVEAYKAENALVGVGGRLVDDDYILRINDQLAKARGDITALRVRADQMRGASVDDVVKGTFPEELTSEALTRLRTSYSDLQQQAAVLARKLGARHPDRLANQESLNAARTAIRAELTRIVAAAQTDLARAEETNAELGQQIEALKAKQISTSGAFVRLRELEREVEASRAVYEAFLLRARETGEQESINTANVRIISAALPPIEPVSLSRKIVVSLGFAGGLALGTILAVLVAVMRLVAGTPRAAEPNAEARRPAAAPVPAPAAASPAANVASFGASAPRWAQLATGAASRAAPVAPIDETAEETPLAAPRMDAAVLPEPLPEPVETPTERARLRESVRMLASAPGGGRVAPYEDDEEAARLQRDIEAVKAEIAQIRRQRQGV
ncbi:GumC family protein [Aurantimonas sp. Leaf443]|uniref:GumC family protein n=1 Tax=Aurantimonas sp. Leaf443 TaxID=1736378 RepID=UPI0006FB0587|nr:GumC family protein [Aurantimonas sp. Leaf443]KQT87916.1 hypothetical protein ASG48_00130 [Aurantimonas sp. Leaf443]